MTFEERLAALGVDLSDLPEHDRIPVLGINRTVFEWKGELLDREVDLYRYIMHLTDVIDRMETRLVNVTGELNYIKQTFMGCATCTDGSVLHSDRCNSCDENYSNYEFAGVLEDWSVDE